MESQNVELPGILKDFKVYLDNDTVYTQYMKDFLFDNLCRLYQQVESFNKMTNYKLNLITDESV